MWDARIDIRALRGRGCPTCAGGRRAAPRLLDAAAYLIGEWAYDLNPNLDPNAVSARSGRLVWWRCQRGHTWRQAVSDRTRGRGCPACFATRGEREGEVLVAVAAATGLSYPGYPSPAPPVRGLRDLVDIGNRVVIEYDELEHRSQAERDRRLTTQMERAGYLVLRIREEGLPIVGGITIDVHRQEEPAAIGRRVAEALAAVGRTIPPATTPTPSFMPRQTPAPLDQRALYPDHRVLAARLPAPSGQPPTSVRDKLRSALLDLLAEGVPLTSPQMARLLVARTGASNTYAKMVLRQARHEAGA